MARTSRPKGESRTDAKPAEGETEAPAAGGDREPVVVTEPPLVLEDPETPPAEAATASADSVPDGDEPDGDKPDGDKPDGDKSDGDKSNRGQPLAQESALAEAPVQTADQTADQTETPKAEVRIERRGGLLGVLAGGAIAAAAGYGVGAYYPPFQTTDGAEIAAIQSRIEALAGQFAELEPLPELAASLESRIGALELAEPPAPDLPDLGPIEAALSDLDRRLAVIEAMPDDGGEASTAALAAALDALRADMETLKEGSAAASARLEVMAAEAEKRLAEAEAQARALTAEAEEAARAASRRVALDRISAAIESGLPFVEPLKDLADLPVPEALAAAAEAGAPSLGELTDAFPAAARDALEASRRAMTGTDLGSRLTAFLQNATGARSLVPRDGDDPDAILSRAEAAVKAGEIGAALDELARLPAEGQAAMEAWAALARMRLSVLDAMDDLSAAISG